jgi:hypothetical protein
LNLTAQRNYKLCLKLCNGVLEKKKEETIFFQQVMVLKAHALERMGKKEEAEKICKEVMEQVKRARCFEPTVLSRRQLRTTFSTHS